MGQKNNLLFYILGVIALFLIVSISKQSSSKSKSTKTKVDNDLAMSDDEHKKATTPSSVLDKSINNTYVDADKNKWQKVEQPSTSTSNDYYDKMQEQARKKSKKSRLYTN